MYNLEPQIDGKALKLRLTGKVLMEDIVSFNAIMREYSKKPKITQLILDVSGVEEMNKAGLGVLVSLSTSMQRYGRRLVFSHITEYMGNLLADAEIEGFFPTVESEEELKGFIQAGSQKRQS